MKISTAFSKGKFDLIWCCEFVEHVEKKYINNFLNDFKTGKNIAMTFAIPGQEGYHHVNCQLGEYWIKKIKKIGFELNKKFTNKLREMAIKSNTDLLFPHSGHLTRILFFENNYE